MGNSKDVDTEKFIKIISLTDSDKDGEVLNSIRMCNRMLKDSKLTWSEFLAKDKKEIKMLKEQIKKLEKHEDELLDYIIEEWYKK